MRYINGTYLKSHLAALLHWQNRALLILVCLHFVNHFNYVIKVADVSWHSLEGLKDGLIDMLSETSFDGRWSDAHSYADFIGKLKNIKAKKFVKLNMTCR